MKRLSGIMIIFLVLMLCSVVQAQQVAVKDLTYITEEYEPYNYQENGELKGIAVDLLKLMWQEMGEAEQPIEVLPWARGYYLLQEKPNTVLFATARTAEREPLFQWACPITSNKYVLIARKDRNIKLDTLDDARQYKIGTILSDIAEQILLNANFTTDQIQGVSDMIQNLEKIKRDRIDLIAYGEESMWKVMREHDVDPNEYETVFTLQESNICYAFHKDTPSELVQRFQTALDAIVARPVYQELLEKYF